jgi:hypothetical protein
VAVLAAWYFFVLGVFVPYVAIKSARRVRAGAPIPPLGKRVVTTLVMEALFLALALFAARTGGIELFAPGRTDWRVVLTATAILALALGSLPLRWRLTPADARRRLLLTRPQAPRDLGWWLVVSAAAAIAEELAYRGVLFALLLPVFGGFWLAAIVCAAGPFFIRAARREGGASGDECVADAPVEG